nr:hypothetical protein Cbor_249 [Cedratvirus borely]
MSRKQPRLIKTLLLEIRNHPDYKTKLGRCDAFIVDCAYEDMQNGTEGKEASHVRTANNKLLRQLWDKLYAVEE